MGSDRVAVEITEGVAHVTLSRPDKFNAMDRDMFAAIGDAFRTLGRDPAVRAMERVQQLFAAVHDLGVF